MKTQAFIASAFVSALMLASCGGSPEPTTTTPEPTGLTGTYSVAPQSSTVKWEGKMLAIGGVSLYGHEGTINVSKGELNFNDGKINGGSVVIDMTTINPTDDAYSDEEGRRASDLVGHLSSDDFFNVAEYPTASFEVKAHTEKGLEGVLTIRGTSADEVIENVSIQEADGKVMASGKLVFDRQQFNAKFSMPVADKILSDDVVLNFDVVAEKVN